MKYRKMPFCHKISLQRHFHTDLSCISVNRKDKSSTTDRITPQFKGDKSTIQ